MRRSHELSDLLHADGQVSCVAFFEEGPNKFVAAAGWNSKVQLWVDGSKERETIHTTMTGHTDDITAITVCPPSLLATGAFDGTVIIWKMDGSIKSTLRVRPHAPLALFVS